MADNWFRKPAVAGRFYESSAKALLQQTESCVDVDAKRFDAIGCILPHAGYVYSGAVAGKTLSSLNVKERIIIIGPNHTGIGAAFSIMSHGSWSTPLGDCPVDADLAVRIMSHCDFLRDDPQAHTLEHSIEVELPLLQYFRKDFCIVPILIGSADLGKLLKLGESIAAAVKELGKDASVLLIASSDMTHYETQENAGKKDRLALEAISALDEELLYRRINEFSITMCGYAPVVALIRACKLLGGSSARVVDYSTSGQVSGDYASVVGYAGVVITR